jgi:hypothetical protein
MVQSLKPWFTVTSGRLFEQAAILISRRIGCRWDMCQNVKVSEMAKKSS